MSKSNHRFKIKKQIKKKLSKSNSFFFNLWLLFDSLLRVTTDTHVFVFVFVYMFVFALVVVYVYVFVFANPVSCHVASN